MDREGRGEEGRDTAGAKLATNLETDLVTDLVTDLETDRGRKARRRPPPHPPFPSLTVYISASGSRSVPHWRHSVAAATGGTQWRLPLAALNSGCLTE